MKKKSIANGKLLRRNPYLFKWEEFHSYISGGYIYFFKSPTDEEYSGYYYLKDCVIIFNEEEPMKITLKNNFGMIDIKYPSDETKKFWILKLKERINEMKLSNDAKAEETTMISNFDKKIDNEILNFGLELNIRNVFFDLLEEKEDYFLSDEENKFTSLQKIFEFSISKFNVSVITKPLTMIVKLSISKIKLVDCNPFLEEFAILVKNSKKLNNPKNKSRSNIKNTNNKKIDIKNENEGIIYLIFFYLLQKKI